MSFNPSELRDPLGKWAKEGAFRQMVSDSPVPGDVGRILDRWVQQGGHLHVSPDERKTIAKAVRYYGGPVPAGLVRGESEQPASRYVAGKNITFLPASFSTEEESALPYAESGSHNPTIIHLQDNRGVAGLNISGRAMKNSGFAEQEHLLAGRFKVARSHVDSEGIRHVYVSPTSNQL